VATFRDLADPVVRVVLIVPGAVHAHSSARMWAQNATRSRGCSNRFSLGRDIPVRSMHHARFSTRCGGRPANPRRAGFFLWLCFTMHVGARGPRPTSPGRSAYILIGHLVDRTERAEGIRWTPPTHRLEAIVSSDTSACRATAAPGRRAIRARFEPGRSRITCGSSGPTASGSGPCRELMPSAMRSFAACLASPRRASQDTRLERLAMVWRTLIRASNRSTRSLLGPARVLTPPGDPVRLQ
jgi:hypothetical protein